jgi:hypothetical protein
MADPVISRPAGAGAAAAPGTVVQYARATGNVPAVLIEMALAAPTAAIEISRRQAPAMPAPSRITRTALRYPLPRRRRARSAGVSFSGGARAITFRASVVAYATSALASFCMLSISRSSDPKATELPFPYFCRGRSSITLASGPDSPLSCVSGSSVSSRSTRAIVSRVSPIASARGR